MKRVYVPSRSALDWKPLLAQPDRHWKAGYSAMSVAQSWEAANGALPPEIAALLGTDTTGRLVGASLLLAIPEYQVALPGGDRPTQTDVFALLRGPGGSVTLAIEGKVDETFGPTIDQKRAEGASDRLKYLHGLLELDPTKTGALRYQLVHRTAAAILLARDFGAAAGAMIVHSFSPDHQWYDDFAGFCEALNVRAARGTTTHIGNRGGIELYLGWAAGDQRFRAELP